MAGRVDAAQGLDAHLGVDGGGFEARMAEEFLDVADVGNYNRSVPLFAIAGLAGSIDGEGTAGSRRKTGRSGTLSAEIFVSPPRRGRKAESCKDMPPEFIGREGTSAPMKPGFFSGNVEI